VIVCSPSPFSRIRLPQDIIELPDRKTLGFRHSVAKNADDSDVVFSVEEIVAMSLQHIMKIAETDAESPVKDCVITVPPFWSHRERQALLDAAEIAGLNVLSLLNENTAAAIQYGIDRKYAANETHTIMLYNMGSTSTKVNIASYSGFLRKERGGKGNKTVGQVEMLAMGYDDTLGGNAFEQRITDFIVGEVNKQLAAKKIKYDILTNPKAMAKIRSAAEKAKTVLSANQESQVFLNSLHEDTDFKMMITREQFQTMVEDLLVRTAAPMQQALDESGMTLEQIDAVVIIGGGVRVPAVQHRIKSFVQKEHLTQSLNGDEAMVMGAVFRAANLSTTFQVRPFGMIDSTPYAVGVRITGGATASNAEDTPEQDANSGADAAGKAEAFSKRAALFKRHNRLSKKKTVQFTHTGDFSCQLSHEAPKAGATSGLLPIGIPLPLDHYNVTGLSKLVAGERYAELLKTQKPKVSLSFLLDASGVSTLSRAEATLEEMVKVPKPKKTVPVAKTNSTANATEGEAEERKEGDAGEKAEEKTEAEKTAEADAAAAASEEKKDDASSTDAASAESDGEPEFTLKKKTHTIPLTVVKTGSPGSIESMNATYKLLAKAALEKLRRADDLKKEIAAAKNTLEAHIYSTRASLGEPEVETVSTEEQREAARTALAAAEDWLYEQGDDSAKVFKDKLSELKALSDPIFFRLGELTAFPIALNTTQTLIDFVRKQVIDYNKNRPWVPEADRMKLKDKVDDLAEWLEEKQKAQAKLTAFEPPALESEMLYERLRPIHKLSGDLAKLKKPIEKPKKKTKEELKKEKDAKKKKAKKDDSDAADDEADEKASTTGSEEKAEKTEETTTTGSDAGEKAEATEGDEDKKDEL
jgi:hypoxia up-regulated 1